MQGSAAYKVGNFSKGEARNELSRQWIARPRDEKYLSLSALRAAVKGRRDRSVERRVDTRKGLAFAAPDPTTIEDTHKLWIELSDGDVLNPSHWTFGQLAGLAKAPAGYLRTLPSQVVVDALNYGMRYNRESEVVKLYSSDDSLLAATGADYGRIFDEEVVEAVMQIAGDGLGEMRWKIPGMLDWRTHLYDPHHPVSESTTTLFASDRDVFIFLVDDLNPIEVGKLPDGSPDLMFRGFYVTNSEVGNGALKIGTFYLRAICCNRIMWGVEGFEEISIRHSKYAPARFIEEARPALQSFANGSTAKLIEGVEKAKAAKLASDDDEMLQFLAGRGFSRKSALSVMEAVTNEEGRPARTAWDLAQGISAAARSIPNTDTRVTMELEARKILDKVAA